MVEKNNTAQNNFPSTFNWQLCEKKIIDFWDANNFYQSKPNSEKKAYTIVMPPPNVTGELTMGHMMYTLQDLLIRWHRALGYEACWIPGFDHASIATEAKVSKMLQAQNISKESIGREKFLQHAWQWKEKCEDKIISALKNLGASCDWSRSSFTMDEKYSAAVIKAIVKLYHDGLIYKSYKLVNWCPISKSVISDEEVISSETNGNLWYIRYYIVGQEDKYLVVATTRPETLFGDLALAVNPDDQRYTHLIGQSVSIPICNRLIPIIADSYVEKDFGTGVVKITPAHDMNDFEVGKRHALGLLNIMNPDASLNDKVPKEYQGLDRFIARTKLLDELTQQGLLDKVSPHKLMLGISERGNVPIEYYLSEQWYIKMADLAQLALNTTRSKKLSLIPVHQEKIWEHWLTNIKDWCISRQLWWGHRLPFYTCAKCKQMTCAELMPQACPQCAGVELTQDQDVLDTWASSWLWPFGVHNFANPSVQDKADLAYYYPTDIIISGGDIIFFWIARMVMAGEYFTGQTPFACCYFTPIVRDMYGKKMSKSLGNSPDISKIIDNYGTDAMRFSLVNQIVQGQDILWKDSCCELGKNFVNKLWNTARFLVLNSQRYSIDISTCKFDNLSAITLNNNDNSILLWLRSEFFALVANVHQYIKKLEFARYTSALYEFSWMCYCDWFIELIKATFADTVSAKTNISFALQIFDGLLRLLHPIIPFVTEELWQQLFASKLNTTLGFQPLPLVMAEFIDNNAINNMRAVQNVVTQVRTIRGKFNIHPAVELQIYTEDSGEKFGNLYVQLEFLAKAKFNFNSANNNIKDKFYATIIVDEVKFLIELAGLVDQRAEAQRVAQKIVKLESIISSIKHKLTNTEFLQGAPAHIVDGAKKQLAQNEMELQLLKKDLN